MLAELSRFNHANTKEEKSHWKDDSESEANTPHANRSVVTVSGKNNQGDNTGNNKAKVDREVSGNCNKNATPLANVCAFVTCFGGSSAADWILSYVVRDAVSAGSCASRMA